MIKINVEGFSAEKLAGYQGILVFQKKKETNVNLYMPHATAGGNLTGKK